VQNRIIDRAHLLPGLLASSVCVSALSALILSGTTAVAQSPDLFRNDPVQYFTGEQASSWIGSGTYFQVNYADTLQFKKDSTGRGLSIRRVLVNADKGAAISRGWGLVRPMPGDTTYRVEWNEKGYDSVAGTMRWEDDQWVIAFDGDWKQWSIRVRQDDPGALVAAAARMIPGFRPVELTAMTYRMASK
jgi:hypothetical protein